MQKPGRCFAAFRQAVTIQPETGAVMILNTEIIPAFAAGRCRPPRRGNAFRAAGFDNFMRAALPDKLGWRVIR